MKRSKHNLKTFLNNKANLFFVVVILIVMGTYLSLLLTSPEKNGTENVIVVEKDMSEKDILATLQEKGLLKNRLSYYSVLFLTKVFGPIEPGGYVFNSLNPASVYNALANPEYKYLAIDPGLRKEQIADKIQEKLNWEENKVSELKERLPLCSYANQEGFFAPGDYLLKPEASLQEIQLTMGDKFDEKYNRLAEQYFYTKVLKNFDKKEIVTIASLIQREMAGRNDARLISGVIWNRMQKGMPLQIDATLQYVKGDEENWWPVPNSEDKFIESPFNTYQNEGLPPEPIANPGEIALAAAMNPIQTSCLFYLHDKRGNIHCSSNYQGHLSNIKYYLR